jgi:hypothetical protein
VSILALPRLGVGPNLAGNTLTLGAACAESFQDTMLGRRIQGEFRQELHFVPRRQAEAVQAHCPLCLFNNLQSFADLGIFWMRRRGQSFIA